MLNMEATSRQHWILLVRTGVNLAVCGWVRGEGVRYFPKPLHQGYKIVCFGRLRKKRVCFAYHELRLSPQQGLWDELWENLTDDQDHVSNAAQ